MSSFVIDSYKLDITPQGNYPVVYLSQHEDGRDIRFSMLNRGAVMDIPQEEISVFVSGIKSNGGYYEHVCTIEDSRTVVMHVESDMTDVSGRGVAILTFTNSSGKKVISAKFIVNVQDGVSDNGIEVPTEAETILQQILNDIRTAATEIGVDINALENQMSQLTADVNTSIDEIDARMDNFLATQSGTSNGTLRTETTLFSSSSPSQGNVTGNLGYFDLSDNIANYDYIEVYYGAFSRHNVIRIKPSDIPIAGSSYKPVIWDGDSIPENIVDTGSGITHAVKRTATFELYKFNPASRLSFSFFLYGWNGQSGSNAVIADASGSTWGIGIYKIVGIKYTDAGTSKDAELTDIRVGTDGYVYDSAGVAVRAQIRSIKSHLDEYEDIFTGDVSESVTNWLDEHPEATTSVEDGSLTYVKLVTGTLGFVTPEMYGAVGDGVTDDTDALQDMYESGNSVFVFSSGKTYLTTGNNITTLDRAVFIGNGATIRWSAHDYTNLPYSEWMILSTKPEVATVDDYVFKNSISFQNLCFDGNQSNQINVNSQSNAWQGIAAYLFGYKYVSFDGCIFKDVYSNAISIRACKNTIINHCYFYNIGNTAVYGQTTTKNCVTYKNSWSASNAGYNLIDDESFIFTNNYVDKVIDSVLRHDGCKNTVIKNNYANGFTTFLEYYPSWSYGNSEMSCFLNENVCDNCRNFFMYARHYTTYSNAIKNNLVVADNVVKTIGSNAINKTESMSTGCGLFNDSNVIFESLEISRNKCTFATRMYDVILPRRMVLQGNEVVFRDNHIDMSDLVLGSALTLDSFISVHDCGKCSINGNYIDIRPLLCTPVVIFEDVPNVEFCANKLLTNFSGLSATRGVVSISGGVKTARIDDNVDNTSDLTSYLSFYRNLLVGSDFMLSVCNNTLRNHLYLVQATTNYPALSLMATGNVLPNGAIFRVSNSFTNSVVSNNIIST